jgi:hypothetical protein
MNKSFIVFITVLIGSCYASTKDCFEQAGAQYCHIDKLLSEKNVGTVGFNDALVETVNVVTSLNKQIEIFKDETGGAADFGFDGASPLEMLACFRDNCIMQMFDLCKKVSATLPDDTKHSAKKDLESLGIRLFSTE